MKKILPFILMLVSGLTITACGGNNQSSNKQGSSTIELDDGDLVFDDDGNIVYNNVEINMWSVTTGDDATVQDEIIADFNNLYNGMIKVNVQHISRYDMESLLTTTMQFSKEDAPDMLFTHSSRIAEYKSKKWLKPTLPVVNKASLNIDEDDYVSSLLDACKVNGDLYGLPQDVHSTMISVRKDILEKNNLSIPTNYQELVNVCDTAIELAQAGNLWIRGENTVGENRSTWRKAKTNEQYYPFHFSFGDMWVHEFAGYTAALQNGAKFVDDKGYPAWNTQEAADGLQVLKDMVFPTETSLNKHALTKIYGADYDVGNVPFRSGDGIFKFYGPWEYQKDIDEFEKYYADDGGASNITTISCSNLFSKDNTSANSKLIKGEGHAFMLVDGNNSRTKECASMVFADYMINNAGIKWAKRGHLPSLKSVEASSDYRNDPCYISYIKNWGSCADYYVYPSTEYYSYVDSYFKNAVQKSLAEQYVSTSIKSLLQEEYEDCVDYIELFA